MFPSRKRISHNPCSPHTSPPHVSLRYASRAKAIKNAPVINEDPKDTLLRQFQDEITRLRARLEEEEARARSTEVGRGGGPSSSFGRDQEGAQHSSTTLGESSRGEVSTEQLQSLQAAAAAERDALLAHAAEAHESALAEKAALEEKIAAMSEKLLIGGHVLDRAAQQEEQLMQAQAELETRRKQEVALARELEEANVMMEDQYASLAEEVRG